MRIKRAIAVTGLVAAAVLVVAVPASGHLVRYGRAVHGSFEPSAGPPFTSVKGYVASGQPKCKHNSLVVLWQVKPGPDARVGSDNTGGGVTFEIPASGLGFPSGSYYLTVKRKVLVRTARHRHSCPALRTNPFTFTNP